MKISPCAEVHIYAHAVQLCIQNVIFKFAQEKGFFFLWWFWGFEGFLLLGGEVTVRLLAVWLLPVLVLRPEWAGVILTENTEQ